MQIFIVQITRHLNISQLLSDWIQKTTSTILTFKLYSTFLDYIQCYYSEEFPMLLNLLS